MTSRDRSIRHALDKLAIVERYAREASAVLAGESYDDRQLGATLKQCRKCGNSFYFVRCRAAPVCVRCK